MYAPSAATQSSVVAVPKSTTTAGVPYSRPAARAFTSRSAPTSSGRSVRTASGTIPARATVKGRSRRPATASTCVVSAGTTEAQAMAVTSANEASSRPSRPASRSSSSSAVERALVAARRVATSVPPRRSPIVTLVFPISMARSMVAMIRGRGWGVPRRSSCAVPSRRPPAAPALSGPSPSPPPRRSEPCRARRPPSSL